MSDVPHDLPQEDLDQLLGHLAAEEVQAEDARLSSLESLQLWMSAHPAMRNMAILDSLNQYGPAILLVLRRLLGL